MINGCVLAVRAIILEIRETIGEVIEKLLAGSV